jgi:hypothetical protein
MSRLLFFVLFLSAAECFAGIHQLQALSRKSPQSFDATCIDGTVSEVAEEDVLRGSVCGANPENMWTDNVSGRAYIILPEPMTGSIAARDYCLTMPGWRALNSQDLEYLSTDMRLFAESNPLYAKLRPVSRGLRGKFTWIYIESLHGTEMYSGRSLSSDRIVRSWYEGPAIFMSVICIRDQ